MKKYSSVYPFLLLIILITSCNGQDKTAKEDTGELRTFQHQQQKTNQMFAQPSTQTTNPEQISQYIRRMFQDKAGNIWFGTNDEGVCRYDGKSLAYFAKKDGLAGNAVRGILQDNKGIMWFATSGGISRYDGKSFTNFTVKDGLIHNDVWSVIQDSKGTLWLGTVNGISRYDGKTFTNFQIPLAVTEQQNYPTGVNAPNVFWSIFEDKKGNIWFGSNGGGVIRFDGKSFTTFTKKQGLGNDFVFCILEDMIGNMWFGTYEGLTRYNGKSFTNYTEKDNLGNNFVWTLLLDKSKKLWIGTAGGGLSRYDGKSFYTYSPKDGLNSSHVQSILEEKSGNLWFGTSGGAYRLMGKRFVNFTKDMVGQ